MNPSLAVRVCCLGILVAALAVSAIAGGSYLGQISGIPESEGFGDVTVLLSGSAVLETTTPDSYGRLGFYGLDDGAYVVQVHKSGYRSPPARGFRVQLGGQVSSAGAENEFVLEQLDPDTFVFHWEEDQSTAGNEYSSRVNRPIEVEFLDEEVSAADGSSANRLLHSYNISLVDEGGESWTHEHAYRLLQTMDTIPQRRRNPYRVQSLPASRWIIASGHVEDDIRIAGGGTGGSATVRIAADAFVHIIHEKAHFLWAYLFDEQLQQDWITLGGWYRNPNDPDGWSTTKQTEFVSAYAHGENPNEDMAESIAEFVINPDKLRSRSISKYEFIRDRIMQGTIYLSKIREDLTFEVYNLYPDYVYPGKIRRVDIEVTGAENEDKIVRIEIELHTLDWESEGAVRAFTRIFSEIGTFTDLYLYPVGSERGSPGRVLSGSFELSKYAKSGYWSPDQIRLADAQSNERFEGSQDFGWSLYVNNPLEDVTPPHYVRNSLSLTRFLETVEGKEVQVIEATWGVDEDTEIVRCTGRLTVETADTYSFWMASNSARDFFYRFDPQESLCRAWRVVPDYMPSSVYTVRFIGMWDRAGNVARVYFGHPGHSLRSEGSVVDEPGQQIALITSNEDLEPPELDLNNISIQAQPTRPDDPNGETLVTLKHRIRDNISGVEILSIRLRDPQGIEHFYYMNPRDGYIHGPDWFPSGDPSQWSDETWTILLPKGSAPGTWGVAEIMLRDRAENVRRYDFTEIVRFDVE